MNMNYIKFGSGKKTLVVIPGMSIKPVTPLKAQLEPIFEVFKKDYTIYLFDRIENPAPNYSIFDMAKDTILKIEELGIKNADFYGASQGGMITLSISYLKPTLVNKMVLASTYPVGNSISYKTFTNWIKLADYNPKLLVEDMIDKIYSQNTLKTYRDTLINSYNDITKQELDNFKIMCKSCIDFDITDKLDKIKQKALIVYSLNDLVLANEGSMILRNKLNCEFIEYSAEYGHAVYDEASDFMQNMYNFLDK